MGKNLNLGISPITSNLFLSSVFATNIASLDKYEIDNIVSILSYDTNKPEIYQSIENKYDLISSSSSSSRNSNKKKDQSSPKPKKPANTKPKPITVTTPQFTTFKNRPRMLYSSIPDIPGTADIIKDIIPDCIKYIHNHRINDNQKVLVHCVAGKSRSASIIIAYLMTITNTDLDKVFKKLTSKREVNPNRGYMAMLRNLDVSGIQRELGLTGEDFQRECIEFYSS